MKSREELLSTAIYTAGQVAACLNLELPFGDVYLEVPRDTAGLVAGLVKSSNIDYSSGVLTPEEESRSTYLIIASLSGAASEALYGGRTVFDVTDYEDLYEVLDVIEYRFANNNVRMTFARYCEAEAFALFQDDRRLWRYTNVLARELLRQKKLTYAQCQELYSKEYLEESWVRKEVEEIKRQGGEATSVEERVEGEEAAGVDLRATVKEVEPQEAEGQGAEGQGGERRSGKRRRGRGRRRGRKGKGVGGEQPVAGEQPTAEGTHVVPVQDRQAPRNLEVLEGEKIAAVGGQSATTGNEKKRPEPKGINQQEGQAAATAGEPRPAVVVPERQPQRFKVVKKGDLEQLAAGAEPQPSVPAQPAAGTEVPPTPVQQERAPKTKEQVAGIKTIPQPAGSGEGKVTGELRTAKEAPQPPVAPVEVAPVVTPPAPSQKKAPKKAPAAKAAKAAAVKPAVPELERPVETPAASPTAPKPARGRGKKAATPPVPAAPEAVAPAPVVEPVKPARKKGKAAGKAANTSPDSIWDEGITVDEAAQKPPKTSRPAKEAPPAAKKAAPRAPKAEKPPVPEATTEPKKPIKRGRKPPAPKGE